MGKKIYRTSDPRQAGGDIAGPGGPFDFGQALLDTRHAVLMDTVEVVKLDDTSHDESFIGMKLEGRINRTPERAAILYFFDLDGAAAIITELLALAGRAGWRDEMHVLLEERLDALDKLEPDDDA